MSVKELVVYRKSEELLYKIYPRLINYPKAEQILNSWEGHAEHGNSYNFIQSLLRKNDYVTMVDGTFKIDMKIINKERGK